MAAANARYRIIGVEHAEILVNNGADPAAIVPHDVHFIREVAFDTQVQDITFEGDNQAVRKYMLNGITAVLRSDTWDLQAISAAFGKNEVTAGLPDGVTGRTYFGDAAEAAGVRCGLAVEVMAENIATNANERLRLVVPVGLLSVVRPPALQYNTKAGLEVNFSGEKTTTDIAGADLPGVTDPIFWFVDRLAAAA